MSRLKDKTILLGVLDLGSAEGCNVRTIYQYVHPAVCKSCQLVMGLTILEPGDLGRSVGCVALAAADAAPSGRKIRLKKEADKSNIQPACGIADRGSLRFSRKHRVGDDGMALRENPQGALHEKFVNLLGHFRLVGTFG